MQYIKYGFLTLMIDDTTKCLFWLKDEAELRKILISFLSSVQKRKTAIGSPNGMTVSLVFPEFCLGVTPESYTGFLDQSNIE